MKYYEFGTKEINRDQTIQKVCRLVNYKGKKIKVSLDYIPTELNSYWDGGSKDTYYFIDLAQNTAVKVHTNHPAFESNQPRNLESLPANFLLVQHCTFCGKDFGLTIYANKQNLTRMIPQNTASISADESIVLNYTRNLKSSYAGVKNLRFVRAKEETGISKETWDNVKASLIFKGLLSKIGAITASGKNAIN